MAAPTSLDGSPALAAMAESMAADAPAASSGATGVGAAATATSSGESFVKDTHAFSFVRDDGSLGGWLPADGKNGDVEAPAPWKVAATVLPAMYAMQEVNRLLLMPGLDVASPNAWGSFLLRAALRGVCVCSGWHDLRAPAVRAPIHRINRAHQGLLPRLASQRRPPPLSRSMRLCSPRVCTAHRRWRRRKPSRGDQCAIASRDLASSRHSGGRRPRAVSLTLVRAGAAAAVVVGAAAATVQLATTATKWPSATRRQWPCDCSGLSSGSGLQQRLRGAMTMKSAESD